MAKRTGAGGGNVRWDKDKDPKTGALRPFKHDVTDMHKVMLGRSDAETNVKRAHHYHGPPKKPPGRPRPVAGRSRRL